MLKLWMSVGLLCLFLTACNPLRHEVGPALTCAQIARFQQLVSQVVSPEELHEQVQQEYGLPADKVDIVTYDRPDSELPATNEVRWTAKDKVEYVAYLNDHAIVRLDVGRINTPGEQLLACLGQPAQYYPVSTWEESGPARNINLLFPAQGVRAGGWQYFGTSVEAIPPVDGRFPFGKLTIVKPQPIEKMVNVIWRSSGPDILAQCKPWPGDWTKLQMPPFPK